MALAGNYIKISYTDSETEVETVSHTYPSDLPEGHEDYDKRGTTVEIEVPVRIAQEEILADKYVMITGITIEKINIDHSDISYAYRIFNSREERIADVHSHIHYGQDCFIWDDESDINPYVRCYEHLKTKPECVNLINA